MNSSTNAGVNIDNKIDFIIKDNKICRFAIELQYTVDEERKQVLKDILQSYKTNPVVISDSEKAKQQIDLLCDRLEQNALKRKWSKLTSDQKVERIRVYLASSITDEEEREKQFRNLKSLLESKKLKAMYINYDVEEGCIVDINCGKEKVKEQRQKKS